MSAGTLPALDEEYRLPRTGRAGVQTAVTVVTRYDGGMYEMRDALIAKARTIVAGHPNSLLISVDQDGGPVARAMWTAKFDDAMAVYYAVALSSGKVRRIRANPHVLLLWMGDGECVTLRGTAEVVTDSRILDEIWRDSFSRYFSGGRSDPEFAVIRVTPDSSGGDVAIELVPLP